jgi:hypothetical protein
MGFWSSRCIWQEQSEFLADRARINCALEEEVPTGLRTFPFLAAELLSLLARNLFAGDLADDRLDSTQRFMREGRRTQHLSFFVP